MTAIQIPESSIPDLTGQTAIVTGGASGIGHATVELLTEKGAKVHVLDLKEPKGYSIPSRVQYHCCNLASWDDLRRVFEWVPRIDMTFVNAGTFETKPYFESLEKDAEGRYIEPSSPVFDINLKASLHCISLSIARMKEHKQGGRIVLTASSTAYLPERCLQLYSAMKLALVGVVRSLRHTLPRHNITINAVAPAATVTPMIEGDFLQVLQAANLPWNSARTVALALAHSATAVENNPVEVYAHVGASTPQGSEVKRRWHGRVIVVDGGTFTEVEEPLVRLRAKWYGEENEESNLAQHKTLMPVDGMG